MTNVLAPSQKIKGAYSLDPNAYLIIGQSFLFTVEVTMPGEVAIPDIAYLSIDEGFKNIKILGKHTPEENGSYNFPIIKDPNKKGVGKISVQLAVDRGIAYGASVTFEISSNIPNFEVQKFKCTAKDINNGTLNLTVVNQYLVAPYPNLTNYSETKVHTIIRDKTNGAVLANTPLFITSMIPNDLEKFDVYDKNDQIKLPYYTFNGMNGVIVSSNENGEVVFYIHAKESIDARVGLVSMVAGVGTGFSPPIYSVYGGASSQNLGLPVILGYSPPGNLVPESNQDKNFSVLIYKYDAPVDGDTVLFFYAEPNKKKVFTGYTRTIIKNDISVYGAYEFSLPYQIFPYNKFLNFSYVIVRALGDTLTSMDLPLTYGGGVPYGPNGGANRPYQPCIVYSSLGIAAHDVITKQINYGAIRQYPNGEDPGLYVQILGTEHPEVDTNKIPIGSAVRITSYINSGNVNGIFTYPPEKSSPEIVKKQSDGIYAVIYIPYSDLVNIRPNNDGKIGTINLEYSILDNSSNNNARLYSEIWAAGIETIPDDF